MSDHRPLVIVGLNPDVPASFAAEMQHEAEQAAPDYRFIFLRGATFATVLHSTPTPHYTNGKGDRP